MPYHKTGEMMQVIDGGKTNDAKVPSLVVKTEVKRVLKDLDHQTAGDFVDAVNDKLRAMIVRAGQRAADNGRKQVRPCDL